MAKKEFFIAIALFIFLGAYVPIKAHAATLTVSEGGTGLTNVQNGYCLSGSSNLQQLTSVPCIATTTANSWGSLQTFNGGIAISSGIKLGTELLTRFSNIFNHRAYIVCSLNTSVTVGCDYTADGVADDVQIQAAYEAASSLGSIGGEVWLSSGKFTISKPINLDKSNVTIRGAGIDATTVYVSNGANVNAFEYKGSSNIIFDSLQSFSIDGNRAHNTVGYGVYINPTEGAHFWDFYVRDVWTKNSASDGFYSYDGHGFVLDHFLSEYNSGDGVSFNGTDEVEIQNGTFKFNGGNGITCANNSCLVQSNESSDNDGYGIEMSGVSGSAIGNTVYLNGLSGIHVTSQPYIKVLNNIVKTNQQNGILVDTSDALVSGNSVYNNSQESSNSFDEIYTAHERVNVTENTIDGRSQSRYGINFNAPWGSGNVSTNNTIINELTAPTHDVAQGTTWFNGGNGKTALGEKVLMSGLTNGVIGNYICIDPVTHELTSGTTCTISSERYKENVIPLSDGALTEVLSLKPVSFNFKQGYGDNGETTQLGFIAEDAIKVDPRLVPLDKDGQPSGFLYQNYTSIMTKAIQELNARVEMIASASGVSSSVSSAQGIFDSITSSLTSWLASASNGINDFFAGKIHTKEICVSDNSGETCITRAQLDALLSGSVSSPNASPAPAPELSTSPTHSAPTTTDTPTAPADPTTTVEPPTDPNITTTTDTIVTPAESAL